MTRREGMNQLLKIEAVKKNDEWSEFLESELSKLDSGSNKRTKKQEENELIKLAILKKMEPEKQYKLKDIRELEGLQDYSIQKLNALVIQLKASGKVIRTESKGTAYFTKQA